MGVIRDAANVTFRDFVTDGVPASGPNKTAKSDVRNLLGVVEDQIGGNSDSLTGVNNSINQINGSIAGISSQIDDIRNSDVSGYLTAATYATLAAITTASDGQGAQVSPADTGTHTDPVSGSVVSNAGLYAYVKSSNHWQWIGSASASDLVAAQSALRVGELLPYARTSFNSANGTVFVVSGSRILGMKVPAGQTGNNDFLTVSVPFTADAITALTGKTIAMTLAASVSAGFLAAHSFNTTALEIGFKTGVHGGALISSLQNGQVFTREVSYTVTGTETDLGVVLQIGSTSTSTSDLSLVVSSLTYRVLTDGSATTQTPGAETLTQAVRMTAAARSGIGDVFADLQPNNTFNLQAAPRKSADGRVLGWTIPAGGFGGSSVLQYLLQPTQDDVVLLAGRTVRVIMGFDCNSQYNRLITPSLAVATAGNPFVSAGDFRTIRNLKPSSSRMLVEVSGICPNGMVYLAPAVANGPDGTTGEDDFLILTDIVIEIISTPADARSRGDENAFLMERHGARHAVTISPGPRSLSYAARKIVAADGSGDFTTIPAAIAAITDAGSLKRYEIRLARGVYTDIDWSTEDFVDLRGDDKTLSIVQAHLPANSSLTDISTKSAFEVKTTSRISSIKATAQNCRYVCHCDSFKSDPNGILEIEDVFFEHLGNQEARNYQTSLGGSGNPSGVWGAEFALGPGASDGVEMRFRRSTFIGFLGGAVGCHTNQNFTSPYRVTFDTCKIITKDPSNPPALQYGSLGSRLYDVIELYNNIFVGGGIELYTSAWLTTAPADQVANKCEVIITGHGNSPTPFYVSDDGSRALRIDSSTTGLSSSISLSGTALSALFGSVVTVAGDVGLAGGAYGTWDVAEFNADGVTQHGVGQNANVYITKLGYRLGDCSSANKTLIVIPDGGSAITITFNANYTSVSNAAILATINAALGSHATASLFNVNDLFRPSFTDEEIRILNTDSTTILRKTAVKYDTSVETGKRMTSADPAYAFAGIAYEDIRPGQWGRVKSAGAVRVANDMIRSDSGAFAFGQTFGIGSTPGQFSAGAATALLRAINTTDVRFLTRE